MKGDSLSELIGKRVLLGYLTNGRYGCGGGVCNGYQDGMIKIGNKWSSVTQFLTIEAVE